MSAFDRIDLSVLTRTDDPRVGSVQVMYAVKDHGRELLLAEAPDRGSVFDIGTVFTIPGSGNQRNTLRHRIYTRLGEAEAWQKLDDDAFEACFSDLGDIRRLQESATFERLISSGARTSHLGLVDPDTGKVIRGESDLWSNLVLIEPFPVVKPERVDVAGSPVYDYSGYHKASTKLVALEHIVRRGNPGGSSLQARYDTLATSSKNEAEAFVARFGLTPPLTPWTMLPSLAVEWSTKFEGYDRYLSNQEALLIAGVDAETFNSAVDLLLLATVLVNSYVSSSGLELWDLKFELAISGDEIVIVDTIDHDSMRLTLTVEESPAGRCVVHFNKQAVRDYYKIFHADWHAALEDAKRRSNLPGSGPFKEIYREGVKNGQYPETPTIDEKFAELQSRKYEVVTLGPTARASTSHDLALEEIDYYASRGRLTEFTRFNARS